MEWLKNNVILLIVVLALVGVAGYALLPMLTLTKEKCVFIELADKASVKMPGMELTGPSSYRSYAPGCGYPNNIIEAPTLPAPRVPMGE